jgi:hypothetical protein
MHEHYELRARRVQGGTYRWLQARPRSGEGLFARGDRGRRGTADVPLVPERGGPCRWDDVCAVHPTWLKASDAIRSVLATTSLAEVAAVDRILEGGTPSRCLKGSKMLVRWPPFTWRRPSRWNQRGLRLGTGRSTPQRTFASRRTRPGPPGSAPACGPACPRARAPETCSSLNRAE